MKKQYIKTPAQKLTENQIDMAEASLDAESNGFVQALNMLGGLSQTVGSSFISKGMNSGEKGFLPDNIKGLQSLLGAAQPFIFANGGTVPVEVEGNEVAEKPNGEVIKFKGPKHEKGGIKTSLPGGTDIFSDRIEIDDETLAKRHLKRVKKEKKFSGDDNVAKNTLKRVKKANQLEEDQDMRLQDLVNMLGPDNANKFATGGTVNPDLLNMLAMGLNYNRNLTIPSTLDPMTSNPVSNLRADEQNNFSINNLLPGVTIGDGLGIFGNIFQASSAYKNTLANRATDTPNINAFENFGLDALETNREAMNIAGQIRDKQLQDLELDRSALASRNRSGARGINTMRALDLAGSIAANKGESDINNAYAGQLLSLLQNESQLENIRDNAVMSGEAQRDIADRQDRDNFYTNRGANLVDIGRAMSETGRSINDIQSRDTTGELMNQLFDYVGFDPMTGKVSQKKNVSLTGNSETNQLASFENSEGYKNLVNSTTGKPFTKDEWNKLSPTQKRQLYLNTKLNS